MWFKTELFQFFFFVFEKKGNEFENNPKMGYDNNNKLIQV